MFAEINYSNQYGAKRSTDPKSDETHDMTHLGVHVQKTISPRTQMAAIQYAKAFAWITGSNEATLDHIKFVLPHILGHKLDYHDDFINDHGHDTRKDMLELHLAGKLVETAFTNYQNIAVEVKNLIHKIQNGKAQEIANSNLDDYDHPYLKELILEVRESLKTPFGRDANQEKSRQGKEATI
jgi:hypothetical protein